MAFVAFLRDEMIGVGRYDRLEGGDEAEVAFAVADAHQGRGLATLLLEYLASYAADNGITRFAADTLIDNRSNARGLSVRGFPTGEPARSSTESCISHSTSSQLAIRLPQASVARGRPGSRASRECSGRNRSRLSAPGEARPGLGIRSFATSSTVASRVLCIRSIPTSRRCSDSLRTVGRGNRRSRRPRGARDPRRAVHRSG